MTPYAQNHHHSFENFQFGKFVQNFSQQKIFYYKMRFSKSWKLKDFEETPIEVIKDPSFLTIVIKFPNTILFPVFYFMWIIVAVTGILISLCEIYEVWTETKSFLPRIFVNRIIPLIDYERKKTMALFGFTLKKISYIVLFYGLSTFQVYYLNLLIYTYIFHMFFEILYGLYAPLFREDLQNSFSMFIPGIILLCIKLCSLVYLKMMISAYGLMHTLPKYTSLIFIANHIGTSIKWIFTQKNLNILSHWKNKLLDFERKSNKIPTKKNWCFC